LPVGRSVKACKTRSDDGASMSVFCTTYVLRRLTLQRHHPSAAKSRAADAVFAARREPCPLKTTSNQGGNIYTEIRTPQPAQRSARRASCVRQWRPRVSECVICLTCFSHGIWWCSPWWRFCSSAPSESLEGLDEIPVIVATGNHSVKGTHVLRCA
jgi:hypothetical protein